MFENWPAAMKEHTRYAGIKKVLMNLVVSIYKRIEYFSCKYSNKILVVVDESKQRLIQKRIPENKIYVVMNCADQDYLKNNQNHRQVISQFKDKNFYITYTGTFGLHRGLELAIRAMPQILEKIPNARLLLVGDGPNKSDLMRLAKKLNVDDKIILTGFVNSRLLPSYIKISNICLVLHTHGEHTNSTVPHKLFEYMFMGKPVIVSDVKPLKRIVNNDKSGIVIKYDIQELVKAVTVLYENKNLYKKYSENARKASIKYSWKVISKNLVKAYNNLIK
jgi:glycosyltransferase involved in cell wall biosynthesis